MIYDEAQAQAQAQAQATGLSHSIAAKGERDNSRLLLLSLVEADGSNVVGQSKLLEQDRDLDSVGSLGGVEGNGVLRVRHD